MLAKPQRWVLSEGLVAPEWRSAWRNLVLLAPLWEGGGDPFDYRGRRFGVRNATSWEVGRFGHNIRFDGSPDNRVNFANTGELLDLSGDLSILVIWKHDGVAGFRTVASKRGAGPDADFLVDFWDGINLQWGFADGAAFRLVVTPAPTANQWVTMVCTRVKNGRNAIFLDGELAATGNLVQNPSSPNVATQLGVFNDVSEDLVGNVALFMLWKRTLSDKEAIALSQDPFGPIRYKKPLAALVAPPPAPAPAPVISVSVAASYTILLRDPRSLALLGEVPDFLAARWRRNQREVGDFELVVNRHNVAADLIGRNTLIEIRRDGVFEFAGIFRYREIGDPALGGQRGDVWKFRGPCLKWWLTNRLINPAPNQYDSQTGVAAETALKHYVEDHLTAPTDGTRDVNNELTVTFEVEPDAGRGADVDFNGRYVNLMGGCLLPLARITDLLHDVVLLDDYSGYRYEVSEPTDATATVAFSVGWDNVEKLIYREDYLSVRNAIYVLGTGTGAARNVELVEDAPSIASDFRREVPVDARQADTAAKLQQIGGDRIESLLDDALTVHAVPAIVGPTLYRQHWDVGYDVTVSISDVGIELTRRIAEVTVQILRDKGEDISISLGARPKTQARHIADQLQRMNPVQLV